MVKKDTHPYTPDDIGELIEKELADIQAARSESDKPKSVGVPVISPIPAGYTGLRRKLQPLTTDDIKRLCRKDLWTINETACALEGYRHDSEVAQSDIPQEVIDAADALGRAFILGRLRTFGPEDVLGRRKYLDREEVIKWAGDRFPKFAAADACDAAAMKPQNWISAEPEVVLPAETRLVPVLDIPRLIAEALYPPAADAAEMTVSYLVKLSPARPRGDSLTGEDVELLTETIWRALPRYRDGITVSEWTSYKAAYDAAENRPEWEPVPVWNNPGLNNPLMRVSAEEQYRTTISDQIHNGRLAAVSHAGVPILGAFVGNGVYVTVPELRRYAETLPIPIRVRIADQGPGPGSKPRRAERPKSISEQHAETVLASIRAEGLDALALPRDESGKAGVKSRIRERCHPMTADQFNRTWKQLRKGGRVKNAS